ncbi:MAG: deoxyuridine 5'-triphosphate nucleotidohydrolase [Lachnospiraceae bacterium]|nr:deoxyuridine 5'-triphosphate nucleotidohydrolase [Lachnospiraceae bacterium]MBR5788699.1 deoxyuridine 5'-triphosphate nucleotidohydrolase [Lachnospiraceae bacterium]
MEKTIKIKYHSDKIEKLRYIDGKSDWIDLRAAEDYSLKKGDFKLINLGVSVQLPKGYEMLIASRSSTFKNFGLIQTNALGIVDESYCADSDVLMWPCLATRDIEIHVNDRLCQFRILEHQPSIVFEEVETLGNDSRGGFGSTGIK